MFVLIEPVAFIVIEPEAGAIVRGSGGVRKLRWRRQGAGKRGGLRVIYFVRYAPILTRLKERFENG